MPVEDPVFGAKAGIQDKSSYLSAFNGFPLEFTPHLMRGGNDFSYLFFRL